MIPILGRSAPASALCLVVLGLLTAPTLAVETAKGSATTAKRAVQPAAPILPAFVVTAMQEGKYTDAIAGLDRLAAEAKEPGVKGYVALIRGVAERLAGNSAGARATWAGALRAEPGGPWAAKIRFELAAAELAAGRAAPAEELARVEAESLLAGDRKDRLAGVYHAFARRLLKPDDPVVPADPNGAYVLLNQARGLAKGPALVASLRLEMARAAQAAKNFPQAIADYQVYLKEPGAAEAPAARFGIGECQLKVNQAAAARLTFGDLAADLDKAPLRDRKDAAEFRAKALHQVAVTHGVPSPGDDAQLALGVAALRRYLAAYPAHPWAVRASYDVARSYLARGKSDQAIAAFGRFLKGDDTKAESDEAKRDLATLTMAASFEVGQVLRGQGKFLAAIDAWKAYLAKYPNGPQSAAAQRALLDTKLLIAADALRRQKYADARSAWAEFVAQSPLDGRVPQVLFQVGESFVTEEKFDEAIGAWEPLLSKFPNTEPSAHAQFLVASLYEIQRGNLSEAIERFRKVSVEPWAGQSRQRVAVMESRELTVVTPRAFRSGETPHLKISTRNLETLTFTAYKLNAESYFRKKQAIGGVESLDISLVAADVEWTVPVAGYGKYKPVATTYDLKVAVPGVWVVKVTDEKHLQATTLVIGSDLDAIVKTSREQLLVFAQDMKTGKGRPNARVIVSDGSGVILEKTTGPDGVLLTAWDKPREPNSALQTLVLDGEHAAGTALGLPGKVAQGLAARAYLYTDRPAYRPGQPVGLRGVVREVKDGAYENPAGVGYRLEVFDSRGRLLVAKPVTLSAFGTFGEAVGLDSSAPVGTYRVRLFKPGGSDFAGAFEVQSYQLEKVDLAFDLPKTVYFRGETVKADLIAKYQYGAPVSNRPIQVALPDGRTVAGQTDARGRYHVEFTTEGFSEEQTLRMVARLPQDNVAAVADVSLAVRAFGISATTTRDLYLDGESFALNVRTVDALGKPTGQTLKVTPVRRVEQGGQVSEVEGEAQTLTTDPKVGEGSLRLRIDDNDGGSYVIRVTGTDQFGNVVLADRPLTISGGKDETRLRLLAERVSFKVGETASVNLHSRSGGGPALVTWEADRVIQYRLVGLKEGDNPLTWAVETNQAPNFTLTAARMAGDRFDEARLDVKADRDLRVTLRPKSAKVGPGDPIEVEVSAVDQAGKPVAAELSVAMVDRSLLRVYGDNLPPIGPFFYNQTRTGAFATAGTNTFRYAPNTEPVAEAIVEEEARARLLADNDAKRGAVLDAAKSQTVAAIPAPAPGGMGMAGMMNTPAAPMAADEVSLGAQRLGRGGFEPLTEKSRLMAGVDASESDKDMPVASKPLMKAKGDSIERLRRNVRAFDGRDRAAGDLGLDFFAEAEGERADPRRRFVETAYWNPAVTTGADGKATITIKAPTALSEYHLTARGTTGADTLVGQAEADVVVAKDLSVDLAAPETLSPGDKPRFIAEVHHVGVEGKAELRLSITAGGRTIVLPKAVTLKGDGVEEVVFEPFDVPEGGPVKLSLAAKVGEKADEVSAEVPVRPWGVPVFASASGSASDNATVFVGLPPGRTYDSPEMLVTIAPNLRRLVVELALGQDAYPMPFASSYRPDRFAPCPPLPMTIADRASELLAASAALSYLRNVKADQAPEAARLSGRIRGLASELVTSQNDDGGWPWVAPVATAPGKPRSDRMTSALAARALGAARAQGVSIDPGAVDRAANFLQSEQSKVDARDLEMRATVQHALASVGRGSFESANALNRARQGLPDAALADLALTFALLDRVTLAGEVLDLLATRARSEPVGPGVEPRIYWAGANQHWRRGPAETTAVVALAFARSRPAASELSRAVNWLLAHRVGGGWQPHKAKGEAVAALAEYYGRAQSADDRYRLVVTVNDAEVYRADINGATDGKAILVPRGAIQVGDKNRVRFEVEGRGTFGYGVTLTGFARDLGPEQNPDGRPFRIVSRSYLSAEPELDGRALPTGFSTVINPRPFQNKVTQLGLGGRARVEVQTAWTYRQDRPTWEGEFLVVEEALPAGASLIDGSLVSNAASHTVADGVLTLYFPPGTYPGTFRYDVSGRLPGEYRSAPTRIRSAYEPSLQHLGPAGSLRVLGQGETPNDPYKATPDELFARGKGHFDAGRLAEAAGPLEELTGAYTPNDATLKLAARMLLTIHVRDYQPRKAVQDFEILKEKDPAATISFDEVAVVARAYRDIGEHERAYLVWRAVIEASYLEDAQVGEALRRRGKTLDAVAYLLDLWREYPDTAAIEADVFGLSQLLAISASKALADPALRAELTEAGVSRPEMLLQSIRLNQAFLARSPKDPLADEVSLAQVGAFLELEDFPSVVSLSGRYAGLFPKSTFLDSFQYSEALGRFNLGEYDRAIDVADRISKAIYKDADGVDRESPNKWQAIYILGQIHDARREPAKAVAYYEKVADRFGDAAGAVKGLTRKAFSLPEVSLIRPGAVDAKPGVKLDYRNVPEADVKVYPVDLMRLYLARRNLDAVAGIDLAGITPLFETNVKLGDGLDFDDKSKPIDLPLDKEGAYLVMARGGNLYASGIVLVSPLELEVLEEPESGRVRVTVRDARTKAPLPRVNVKVIGGDDPAFLSGRTDPRGVFVAEGIHGQVTAVARRDAAQYAFYRGKTYVGTPRTPAPAPNAAPAPSAANAPANSADLGENVKKLNYGNSMRQLERLENRYKEAPMGIQVQQAEGAVPQP